MKKKIQTLGGLALAAIVGVNGYMATTSNYSASELQLDNIENVAEGEKPNGRVSPIRQYGQGEESITCNFVQGNSYSGGSFNGFNIDILGCGGGADWTPSSSTGYSFTSTTVTYKRKYCTEGNDYYCQTDPRDCAGLFSIYGYGKAPGEL